MKADPEVKMISAEAPILFAKGCDIFITELTMRAWIHAEDNKRRTLQRSDIAAALAKSDMFDFLIDIVPREESSGQSKRPTTSGGQQAAANQAQAAQQPAPAQQQMGAPDYSQLQHGGMAPPDQQYGRPPAPMYPGAHLGGDGQQDPTQYGQPAQMFAGQDMYNPYAQGGFPSGQQVCLSIIRMFERRLTMFSRCTWQARDHNRKATQADQVPLVTSRLLC
jgi:nuclear transcription factor Y, gamma